MDSNSCRVLINASFSSGARNTEVGRGPGARASIFLPIFLHIAIVR